MLGQAVGSYRVEAKIGEGGMGAVYLARHTVIGRRAAIKVLLPELSANEEVVNRFFNEARTAGLLKHAGIVDIYDFGRLPGGPAYIVMEYLDGESLAQRLRRERLPIPFALSLVRQIALAVGAAHEQGIIHRDLKPENVLLVPDAEIAIGVRAKVLDFGIAKLGGEVGSASMRTRTGSILGTPSYMSPEQCGGAGRMDARTDIYSVGCMLFELVCGRLPFVREGAGEVLGAHLYEPPPRPSLHDARVTPALEALILRALAKSPADRQQTMAELAAECQAVRHSIEGATPQPGSLPPPVRTLLAPTPPPFVPTTLGSSSGEVAPPRPPRRRALYLGLAALTVILGGGVAALTQGGPRPPVVATASPPPLPRIEIPVVLPPDAGAIDAALPDAVAVEIDVVTLVVESKPPGAECWLGKERVGKTPCTISRPRGDGELEITVRKDGCRSETLTLSTREDGTATAELHARDGAAPPASDKRTPYDPFSRKRRRTCE